MASELHRHEDEHSWQKFQYFITLTGIIISATAVVWTSTSVSPNATKIAISIISGFGFITSCVFSLVFKRSQMFHLYRSAQAREVEENLKINNERVLTLYEKNIKEQKLIKVSIFGRVSTNDINFYLPLFFALCWLALFIMAIVCNIKSPEIHTFTLRTD